MTRLRTGLALMVAFGFATVLLAQQTPPLTGSKVLLPQFTGAGSGAGTPSLATSKPNDNSACRSQEYRQFDFWLGDWDVHRPNGPTVGHNLVTVEQDGCLLVEHWKSSQGRTTGTSFNYYDVRDEKWHQLYLDNSGNAGAYPAMAGNFVNGKMVLMTDEKQTPVFRWTWYTLEPGKVRQMAEQSDDGQKNWTVIWDSVYVKQRDAAPPSPTK